MLVSRMWSGKTLADHRTDRQDWLLSMLGVSATDPARYRWELVTPADLAAAVAATAGEPFRVRTRRYG